MVWYWVLRKRGLNHDISTSFHRLVAVQLRSMQRVLILPTSVRASRRDHFVAVPTQFRRDEDKSSMHRVMTSSLGSSAVEASGARRNGYQRRQSYRKY